MGMLGPRVSFSGTPAAIALALVVFAAGTALLAQSQDGSARQQPAPAFRAGTTLVEVDAIVKDKGGRFVPDLTADDFEIREDGTPQHVEQFYVVLDPAVRAAMKSDAISPAASAAPPGAEMQRTFVVLFDDEHMMPGALDRAKKAALQFLDKDFRAGDLGGIVSESKMANNRLTKDKTELEAAVRTLKPNDSMRSLQIDMREWPRLVDGLEAYQVAVRNDRETTDRAVARACADDGSMCNMADAQVRQKAARLVADLRVRGQRSMRTIAGLSNGLSKLPGRKTIIFLTEGFFTEDTWADLRQVVDLANRASVRIYSLDTRGLNRGSAGSDIFEQEPHSINPAGEVASFDAGADGPNSLAIDTGGLMIRNENDFGKAFSEIAADTSSYYVLGYRTTNTRFDGKFRQISVRVKRPGTSVRARKGYLATAQPSATAAPPSPAEAQAARKVPAGVEGASAPLVPTPLQSAATGAARTEAPSAAADLPTTATTAIRIQPDVNGRLASLGKLAPDRGDAIPAAVAAQAKSGWEAYQRGDLKAARESLESAAGNTAAPPWVHYTLGWTLFAASDYRGAIGQWETVRSAVPAFEGVYFELADGYLQEEEYEKAIDVLRQAEKRWPSDVEVYNAIGVVQTRRYAFTEALKTFGKAVTVNPKDPTANYNLARVCELRYIQTQRMQKTAANVVAVSEDRDCALEYYRRTVDLDGLFKEQAAAGLKRLQ